MLNFLDDHEDKCYAAMRIVVGLLFFFHGTNYVLGFPSDARSWAGAAWYMQFVGVPILFLGGLCTCIGFQTRIAAFLSSGMMAFAYWMTYAPRALTPPESLAHNSFIKLIIPNVNGGELATVYCFIMLYIAARGAGIWSVDAARGN